MSRTSLLLPLLALAACGESADKGTSITLKSDNGETVASADAGTGAVKLDLPGFKADLQLPKLKLDADDFDLNGVHLYPGSTVDTLDVRGSKGSANGGVRVTFSSPASPATVRDWFDGRLKGAGYTLRREGDALVGTDDKNKPFRMDLSAQGADRTGGTILIGS